MSGRASGPCSRDGGSRAAAKSLEQVVEVVIDEWVYDFGKNRFIEYLTFEHGRLVSVRSRSYGRNPAALKQREA